MRVVYGVHAVTETIRVRPGEIDRLFIARGAATSPRIRDLMERARRAGLSIRVVGSEKLRYAAGGEEKHQGVVAHLVEFAYRDLEELTKAQPEPALVVVLDEIQDPRNLGAVLRSAEAFGAGGVVIARDRSAEVTAVAAKAAAGAAERVPVARVTNLRRALDELKSAGFWIVGTDRKDGDPPPKLDLTAPTALVLGGEAKGLRRLVREACDALARIPLSGAMLSLNVSVAAGILLYEARRQRARW